MQAYAKAGYDKPFETYGIWSYAAVEVLADAIHKANAAGKLTRRGIVDVMKTATFSTVLGDASFPRPGDIKQRVMGYYTVSGGKWVMTHRSDANAKLIKLEKPEPLDP